MVPCRKARVLSLDELAEVRGERAGLWRGRASAQALAALQCKAPSVLP